MSTEAVLPAASPSLQTRFRTGFAFNVVGAVFNQGSTFAFNVVAANLLGLQIFGKYAMIQSTLATLALVAQMSAGFTATKFVAEFRSTNPRRAGAILGMLAIFSACTAGIGALFLLLISGWLSGRILKAPELAVPLAIGSLVLLCVVLNGFLMGALAGMESYRRLAIALVWSGMVYLTICTALAWRGALIGAVSGLAISALLQFTLLALALWKECKVQGIQVQFGGMSQERDVLLKFVLPAGLSGFTTMPAFWLAGTFLVRQPGGYSQMAIYSAAFSLMTAVVFLPNIVNNVGMSLINHFKGTGDEVGFRQAFWTNFGLTMGIVAVGATVVGVAGPQLLRIFGKNFNDGYPVLLTLLATTIPQGAATALYQVIQSHAKMWLSFLAVALPRDVVLVTLAYLRIPPSGAMGFALACAGAYTLAFLATLILVMHTGLGGGNSLSERLR